jgi:hypothetical protein
MAVFGPLQLTTNGQALYAKAQTGTTLTFTRMQIGGGQLAGQDETTLTALISPIAYFNINSELANGSTAIIRGIFENTNLTQSTYVCEIGLFAQDPTAGEILYAYANAGAQGDTLPPISDGPISRQFNLNITIGNATNVTVNIPANTYIPVNQMGVANGVPTLDGTGKVPVSQIPSLSYIPTSAEGTANGVATLDSNGKVPTTQIYTITGQTNNFSATQQFTATTASIEANQIVLGQTNNVSSPASTIYLASANASGMGMDQYGNLLPISPGSVTSGQSWTIKDKSGNTVFQALKDGTKKLATANSTLDDGSGNATFAGMLSGLNPYCFVDTSSQVQISSANTLYQLLVTSQTVQRSYGVTITNNAIQVNTAGVYCVDALIDLSGLNNLIEFDITIRVIRTDSTYYDESHYIQGWNGLGGNSGTGAVPLTHSMMLTLTAGQQVQFLVRCGESPRTVNKYNLRLWKISN